MKRSLPLILFTAALAALSLAACGKDDDDKKDDDKQDEDKKRTRDICKRLEAKLDKKNKSIRQAFKCQYSNEGDGCPVLNEDENSDPCQDKCATCTIKKEHEHVNS